MCRLFAYVAPETSTADAELGQEGLEGFLSLARLHGDGWGWAGTRREGDAPSLEKSSASAARDSRFRAALREPARAAMVHLRWATAGLPVELCNAHPFLAGELAFEHNGSLKPIERARALLSPAARASMTGDTDSEMYFALIRERIDAGASLSDAVVDVVRRLRIEFPLSSLNAILLDREVMVVVHASARSGLPDEHNDDYFALRWLRTSDGTVLVGSTGIAKPEWEALPAESVTTIRLDDRTTQTVRIERSLQHADA